MASAWRRRPIEVAPSPHRCRQQRLAPAAERLPLRAAHLRGIAVALVLAVGVACRAADPRPATLDVATNGDGTHVGMPEQLADHLWIVPGGGCNTAVFETTRGVVVVDPKFASSWPDLVRAIRTLTDAPITHVIVTHFHVDHAEAVAVMPPAIRIVAQRHTVDRMIFYRYLPDDAATSPRVQAYDVRLDLFEGDDAVTLLSAGPAHTSGDTVAYLRRARIAHVGDIFARKGFPIVSLESGGDGRRHPETVRATLASLPDLEREITGHGPVLPRRDFEQLAELMELANEYVGREMRMFRDKAKVFRAFELPPAFADVDRSRQFETLDEIDRSRRPRWQRVF